MIGNDAKHAIANLAYKYFEPHDGADADVVKITPCKECRYEKDCSKQIVLTRRDGRRVRVFSREISSCSYGERRGGEGKRGK